MNVSELIEKLQALPQDAEVRCIWDGSARSGVVHAYLARGGRVMLADSDEVVYDDENRPIDAPTQEADRYWHTPDPDEESA